MKKLSLNAVAVLYSAVHFSVEIACFFFLFSRLRTDPLWWGFAMLFDALAFIPQSFIGIFADAFPKVKLGVIGCAMIFIALVIPWNIPALVIISLGNAAVHIDGAQKTLSCANGKITPCSIFVGGGSFGVVSGQLLGSCALPGAVFIPLVLIAVSALLTLISPAVSDTESKDSGFAITADRHVFLLVTAAFIAVAIRSYAGYAVPNQWNKTALQTVALFCSMGIGKILGGVLSDRIGYGKTAVISLGAALPFLLFGNNLMYVSLIGVGLISMTMSITIAVLVSVLPKSPCFAFGITTVALFTGVLPVFFIIPSTLISQQITVTVFSLVALASLKFCIKKGC